MFLESLRDVVVFILIIVGVPLAIYLAAEFISFVCKIIKKLYLQRRMLHENTNLQPVRYSFQRVPARRHCDSGRR